MDTQDEMYKKIKSYEKKILDFDSCENNFKPAHYPPKEDGMYITIRCGFAGLFTTINLDGNEVAERKP